jgi:hypothetical protein
MKSIIRLLLGVISSALLAVGFAQAADQLDPMNHSLPAVGSTPKDSAPSCTSECFFTSKDV